VEWFWWDRSLSQWPIGFLQCFDAVGWVIWPAKIVPIVTRAAVLMFPLLLQSIISNQMRPRRLRGESKGSSIHS